MDSEFIVNERASRERLQNSIVAEIKYLSTIDVILFHGSLLTLMFAVSFFSFLFSKRENMD